MKPWIAEYKDFKIMIKYSMYVISIEHLDSLHEQYCFASIVCKQNTWKMIIVGSVAWNLLHVDLNK